MLIRTRTGMTLDGFVATPDGVPVLASMPDFRPGESYGYREFIKDCDAVVMGRRTFLPALRAPSSPWPGLDVYVLTSSPLPPGTPPEVIVSQGGPEGLLEQLRARTSDRDVHLVGGPATIRTFLDLHALDRIEILVLPFLAGAGVTLSPAGTTPTNLRRHRSDLSYPDGTVELVYLRS